MLVTPTRGASIRADDFDGNGGTVLLLNSLGAAEIAGEPLWVKRHGIAD
jgi:hypothetical protein